MDWFMQNILFNGILGNIVKRHPAGGVDGTLRGGRRHPAGGVDGTLRGGSTAPCGGGKRHPAGGGVITVTESIVLGFAIAAHSSCTSKYNTNIHPVMYSWL